ncbi:hypothetical protein HHI36_000770 [Cryptolaemus montrouzieri]|uniref:Uncharacterized protein n=1 Tax=Cryptolaemus montrouzieri TaxID=559131 RepID=A0ABD2P5V9_9CUCU
MAMRSRSIVEFHSYSCYLDTQVDSKDQLKLQGSDDGIDGKQYNSSVLSQQGNNVQLASSDLLQSSSKYEIIDIMDPGGPWPIENYRLTKVILEQTNCIIKS